jgi:hypothetical protein
VEKVCSDDILSPICDSSYDGCAPWWPTSIGGVS